MGLGVGGVGGVQHRSRALHPRPRPWISASRSWTWGRRPWSPLTPSTATAPRAGESLLLTGVPGGVPEWVGQAVPVSSRLPAPFIEKEPEAQEWTPAPGHGARGEQGLTCLCFTEEGLTALSRWV